MLLMMGGEALETCRATHRTALLVMVWQVDNLPHHDQQRC
jgi:hypothetical protein